jgi:hypothetical protein
MSKMGKAVHQLHESIMREGIRFDGAWNEEVVTELVTQFFDAHGYSLDLDKESSASRQHYIDTGHYLPKPRRQGQLVRGVVDIGQYWQD